jgi:hypothetical protein
MNKVTSKPNLDSFYDDRSGVKVCKICEEREGNHKDNCVALFFGEVEIILCYHDFAGDCMDWLEKDINCNIEDKNSLVKTINSAFCKDYVPKNILKNSPLSTKNYYIQVRCSCEMFFDRDEIEALDLKEKNNKYLENEEERIKNIATENFNKKVREINKIKDILKDGIYEEKMNEFKKEYEEEMNKIYQLKQN